MIPCDLLLLLFLSLHTDGSRGSDSNTTDDDMCLSKKNKTLHLVVMAPLPDSVPELSPGWVGGPAVVPSTMLAIQHINSRCDVLEDYALELVVADSGCDVSSKAVLNTISRLFYSDLNVVGIIGPGCSEATAVVGRLMGNPKISLLNIAPSATSPDLVNQTAYPNTFRPIGSSLGFIDFHSDFIASRNYTTVGVLFEAGRGFHKAVSSRFQKRLQEMQISVSSFGLLESFVPLSTFRNTHKIIFVFAGSSMSRKLMCLAYCEDMIYPAYQYIFIERRLRHFIANVSFSLNGIKYKCTERDMERAVAGIILNLIQLIRTDVTRVLVNKMDYRSFYKVYRQELENYMAEHAVEKVVDTEHQSGYYDSTWALALSYHASIPRLAAEGMSLEEYRFGHMSITDIVREELLNVSFEGIRGKVQFSNETLDGVDVTVLNMYQVQEDGKSDELVAQYDPTRSYKDQLEIINESLFVDDNFAMAVISPPIYVEVIVAIALIIAAFSTIAFHIMNIIWGRTKSMRVTSPHLNHIIFSGCYLYMLSILFIWLQMAPEAQKRVFFGVRCSGLIWCESIALTLIFATISVKLWRIYRIFSHSSADILANLSNYRLVLYVCVALFVDIVFNMTWNLVDPWYRDEVDDVDETLRIRMVCNCRNIIVWLSLLVGMKALLCFVLFYFSLLTRRISKAEYKQTKSSIALIYSLIFLYCFTIPVHLILLSKTSVILVTISYLALCFKNLACIALCTAFIFLPPILPILKQKWKYHILKEIS